MHRKKGNGLIVTRMMDGWIQGFQGAQDIVRGMGNSLSPQHTIPYLVLLLLCTCMLHALLMRETQDGVFLV